MKTDIELIAEFMEERFGIELNFSWDYLHLIIQKIAVIASNAEKWPPEKTEECSHLTIISLGIAANRESTIKAIIEFIKWYNSQKTEKEADEIRNDFDGANEWRNS